MFCSLNFVFLSVLSFVCTLRMCVLQHLGFCLFYRYHKHKHRVKSQITPGLIQIKLCGINIHPVKFQPYRPRNERGTSSKSFLLWHTAMSLAQNELALKGMIIQNSNNATSTCPHTYTPFRHIYMSLTNLE